MRGILREIKLIGERPRVKEDRFVEVMGVSCSILLPLLPPLISLPPTQAFLPTATTLIDSTNSLGTELEVSITDTLKWFGEDPKSTTIENLGTLLVTFGSDLDVSSLTSCLNAQCSY